jgi:hypothetical protein
MGRRGRCWEDSVSVEVVWQHQFAAVKNRVGEVSRMLILGLARLVLAGVSGEQVSGELECERGGSGGRRAASLLATKLR